MSLSTQDRSAGIQPRVARKRKWHEDMQARFAKGTFARIEAVLDETEDRTDFVRDAVSRELERREAQAAKRRPKGSK